jgi:hypothetical protein
VLGMQLKNLRKWNNISELILGDCLELIQELERWVINEDLIYLQSL